MMALLSGAWWAQRLSSVGVMAAVAASVALALAGSIAGGLWWLRADAAHDANEQCKASQVQLETRVSNAARDARNQALGQANETLRMRAMEMDAMRAEIEKLSKEKADALAASKGGDAIAVPAGDPWVLGRRKAP